MDGMSEHDWLVPGREVVALYTGFRSSVAFKTTIERVTQRDVILANGRRYSARWLTETGSGRYSGPVLYPSDHPTVLEIRAERERESAFAALEDAVREVARNRRGYDREQIAAVMDAARECERLADA